MSVFRQLMMKSKQNNNILYQPKLDGSEQITTLSGQSSPYITNNILQYGSGYLTEGWDNTILWKLTFEAYSTGFNNNTGVFIILPTATNRDQDEVMMLQRGDVCVYANSILTDNFWDFNSAGVNIYDNWTTIEIEKTGNTSLIMRISSTTKTFTWSKLSSTNKMCIGVDTWGNDYSKIRNILVVRT